jgi:hypothetical protein
MAECDVCEVLLDKERIHYGGISCDPCRQFFRRKTNAVGQKTCKWGWKCALNHWETRMCQACRYQKCLAIGMRKDLVLETESRIRKVRKLNQHEGENAKKQEPLWDVSEESSDDGFEIQSVTQCQEENLTVNESILDPETGHLDAFSGAHWRGWEFQSVPVRQKDDLTFNTSDLATEVGSRFPRLKESTDPYEILDGDTQISYYIHKKFRKKSEVEEPEDTLITKESIRI